MFLEPKQLGWDPLVNSFIDTMPEALEKFKTHLQGILTWLIDTSISWAFRYGKFLVHKSEMTLVNNAFK